MEPPGINLHRGERGERRENISGGKNDEILLSFLLHPALCLNGRLGQTFFGGRFCSAFEIENLCGL
jgi:hypothetical protein